MIDRVPGADWSRDLREVGVPVTSIGIRRRPVSSYMPLSRLRAGILAGKSSGLPPVYWGVAWRSRHWPAVDQWFPNSTGPLKFECALVRRQREENIISIHKIIKHYSKLLLWTIIEMATNNYIVFLQNLLEQHTQAQDCSKFNLLLYSHRR